ncbi:MAG TPA: site-specific integrase [Polyangia bacterium]|nr:site-specific integrase [Polyangia bacterium]
MLLMASWMKGLVPTDYPGIWKTQTGYRVRVRAVDPKTGMLREANKTYHGITIRDALKRQVAMREELQAGASRMERMRVGEFARLWIESKAGVVARYTLTNYADALDKHILPIIGKLYYDVIGHLEVQGLVNELLAKRKPNGRPYSRRSVKDFFDVFRNMTKDAIVHLDLDRDPTLRISFGEHFVAEAKKRATIADCMAVLDAMKRKRPGSYALLHTKACTGQRFCHVSALKWNDVEFDAMLVRFRRKQVRGVVGPISSRKPVPKEMPLLPELAETLRAHKTRMEELGYPVDGDAWIFPSRTRKLKTPSSLRNAIKASVEEAKVTAHITPHRMRYAFSDLLRRAHVDKVTRKAMVGHVTDEMQEHYSTVLLDEKREAMDAVAAELKKERRREESGDDGGYRGAKEAGA